MPRTRRPANDALLCEDCGYDLAGLTRNDNCPECGKPIAESLPENRTGTPWQRWDVGEPWFHTAVLMIRHPRSAWGVVRYDDVRIHRLIFRSGFIAGATFLPSAYATTGLVAWIAPQSIGVVFRESQGIMAVVLVTFGWIASTALIAMIVRVLTRIEVIGITHFGKRRGWRTDRILAQVICAHASVLWVFASAFVGVAFGVEGVLPDAFAYLILGGFLLGMLLFETWVYLGFRAMRYANPPGSERHLRDHAGDANTSTAPPSPRRI